MVCHDRLLLPWAVSGDEHTRHRHYTALAFLRTVVLLECTQHGIGTDMQGARVITHSTGIKTHVDDHVLDLRQASAVAIVEQNTALGTEGVLASGALGSSRLFAGLRDH